MQLYKKVSSLSQMVWDAAKKNHLGVATTPQVRARVNGADVLLFNIVLRTNSNIKSNKYSFIS